MQYNIYIYIQVVPPRIYSLRDEDNEILVFIRFTMTTNNFIFELNISVKKLKKCIFLLLFLKNLKLAILLN